MKTELFDELVESVREGDVILRGEVQPDRIFEVSPSSEDQSYENHCGICIGADDPDGITKSRSDSERILAAQDHQKPFRDCPLLRRRYLGDRCVLAA